MLIILVVVYFEHIMLRQVMSKFQLFVHPWIWKIPKTFDSKVHICKFCLYLPLLYTSSSLQYLYLQLNLHSAHLQIKMSSRLGFVISTYPTDLCNLQAFHLCSLSTEVYRTYGCHVRQHNPPQSPSH